MWIDIALIVIFGIVTLFFFVLWINLLYVSIGFRKKSVKKANAYLRSYKFSKDINSKRGFIKYWTAGKYAYRVNGKYYFVHHALACKPDKMPDVIKVTYQVRHPDLAYIYFPGEIVAAVLIGLLALLLVGLYV